MGKIFDVNQIQRITRFFVCTGEFTAHDDAPMSNRGTIPALELGAIPAIVPLLVGLAGIVQSLTGLTI